MSEQCQYVLVWCSLLLEQTVLDHKDTRNTLIDSQDLVWKVSLFHGLTFQHSQSHSSASVLLARLPAPFQTWMTPSISYTVYALWAEDRKLPSVERYKAALLSVGVARGHISAALVLIGIWTWPWVGVSSNPPGSTSLLPAAEAANTFLPLNYRSNKYDHRTHPSHSIF